MAESSTNLLLLNASNYPQRPIFPYAFVQVSAVARRFGRKLARHDLLNLPPTRWPTVLGRLLQRHRPKMIGLHLRNVDSLIDAEYLAPKVPPYLPAEATRDLIAALRQLTDAPIVVGGFGFTSHAERLVSFLQPDFAIQGEGDDLFARFDEVLAGRALDSVGNLVYRDGGGAYRFNPRQYFAPLPVPEYDEEIIAELKQFYGVPSLHAQTVAVEVARGCPFRCYFCTEPTVKGKELRKRDLDAVFTDVERLLAHDLTKFFFISSEVNIDGSEFVLSIAERMTKLRERHAGEPIRWTAYSLPTLTSLSELRDLVRSGYIYSWNEAQSLDDGNLKETKVPYRSRHVLAYVKNVITIEKEGGTEEVLSQGAASGRILTLFLGNAHATPETIRKTLRVVHEEKLADEFESSVVMRSTRVFDDGGINAGAPGSWVVPTQSLVRGAETRLPDLVQPTFHFPEQLIAALGSIPAYNEFFDFIEDTFLSKRHQKTRRWQLFLANHSKPELLARFIAEAAIPVEREPWSATSAAPLLGRVLCPTPSLDALRELMTGHDDMERLLGAPANLATAPFNVAARTVAGFIAEAYAARFAPVLDLLGIPRDQHGPVKWTPYEVMRHLYARHDSNAQLVEAVMSALDLPPTSVEIFCLQKYLYDHNVKIKKEYRPLLFD